MDLVDIGVNLTHRSLSPDRAEVMHRAQAEGVCAMLVTGLSVDVSERAAALARAHPATLASTAGIHPHNARSFDEGSIPRLRALLSRPKTLAVGECGLDFNRDFSPRPAQHRAFRAQLELAAEVRRPVFLHERDAFEPFLKEMTRARPALVGGVVHCFTGDRRALEAYLDLDLHIGVTGWVTDPRRGRGLLELVEHIPADRLLIETDAPFLTPHGVRPPGPKRRNEPSLLPHVLRAVARARGEPPEQLAAQTTSNARRLFGDALFESDAVEVRAQPR